MIDALQQFVTPITTRTSRGVFFLILTIMTILYLGILQIFPTMLDPDGFFHAKMALLTIEQGFITSFPYLPETILATYWTDQHFLYHVFLAPFVLWLNPLWGVKLAAFLLGVGYILIFFTVLKNILKNERTSFWWSIVLLTASPFVFRLILVKAQPFAFIFLLLGYLAFLKRKHVALFLLQFLYVLSHGSFLLLPGLIIWSLLFSLFFEPKTLFENRLPHMKSIGALFFGVVIGLLVQPTFPENIVFYWYQIVTIGIVGIPTLAVSAYEWQSISLYTLIKNLSLLSVLTIVTIPFAVQFRNNISKDIWMWSWLLIPLVILSLTSIRNIEFLVPFLIIAVASLWTKMPTDSIKRFFSKNQRASLFGGGFATLVILIWVLYPLVLMFSLQKEALRLSAFEKEAIVLNKYATEHDIILNTRWDAFPMLFYYTDSKRFLTGLDPAFLYVENPELYESLVVARESGDIDSLLSNVSDDRSNLYLAEIVIEEPTEFMSKNSTITKIISDDSASLYSIELQ